LKDSCEYSVAWDDNFFLNKTFMTLSQKHVILTNHDSDIYISLSCQWEFNLW